ncbi:unnamed protein product [Somion occarium]|uniref:Beta-glucuronidase C-terminal domain-containing protein n=1 Tax=Somion occarium TaxID=3059160 RepID=A0ABP1CUU1_9APHY
MAFQSLFLYFLSSLAAVRAITVYNQQPLGQTQTSSADGAAYTGYQAYNPATLNAPGLPDPLPATQFGIQLQSSAAAVTGLSIPVSGALFGFSIETSVINQFLGVNSSFIQVPFLNLVSNIVQRAGRFHIRVGGNTQETARLVDQTADGRMIEKQSIDPNNPTATPVLIYTMEMFYLLANISSLMNVKWYLGIPLNDTSDLHLEVAQYGEQFLGDNLLGLQVGNEPDLYARHQHRPENYGPADYVGEVGDVIKAMQANGNIPNTNNIIGPSVSTATWTPEMVFDAGFITQYQNNLAAISVENYPTDNCFAIYGGNGSPHNPQDEFINFLTHDGLYSGKHMIEKFLGASAVAQQSQKQMLMFETNTASCGGFPGSSNSFGSALWGVDYGLQLAYSNFSHALLHCGGQDVFYNRCLAPPTGLSAFHEWTIGPLMYSILVVSEALGSTNNSRVIDLFTNDGNVFTPGYAIYENDQLARVLLINYMTDASGANDYTATISVGGGDTGTPNAVPAQVKVKYLSAPTVAEHFNITWAGQTFGGQFESDGRLKGNETIETINCDQGQNTCAIKVPAPGVALVFFSDQALQESEPSSTATFATTAVTRTLNTATIDAQVLATSNGHSGKDRALGSTSKGSTGAAPASHVIPSLTALFSLLAGVLVLFRAFTR